MLKGVFEMDWWFLLIKGFVLNVHVEGYKALLWSSLVLLLSSSTSVSLAIGGPFLPPLPAKTTSGYSDGFRFAICGWLYFRGWESKVSSTHFLLPASLENKDQLFSVLDFQRSLLYMVRVAKVWPCSGALLKVCYDAVPTALSKTSSGDQGVGLPCAVQNKRSI